MEPINSRCEMITCECGGKFQRKALNKHAGTKMHINFGLKREAEAEKEMLDRLKLEAEETIMHIKRTPSEEDIECWRQEIEDIKEQELRDNNAEVEAWKAEEEEENARLANIPKKKSCVVKIQVSKEFKTREERVKFDLESSGKEALNRLAVKFATRGKEEPQNESRTVYSWERPYHQPGFRD